MKTILKTLFTFFVTLYAKLVSYNLLRSLQVKRNIIYTMWIRNFIGSLGTKSYINYPCSIQGDGAENITIGNKTCIQSHGILGCWSKYGEQHFSPSISIGDDCNIGEYVHISSCNKIVVGNGLLTGRFVYIGDNSHGALSYEESTIPPQKRKLISKGQVNIGNNVWIGDKVTILGNVNIGDNVIIGANSVVLQDIPSNSIAAGVPARVVKIL